MTVTIAQLRTVYIGRKPAPEGMNDWRGLCDLLCLTIRRHINLGKTLANYTRYDLLRVTLVITEHCHMKLRTYELGNFHIASK